VVNQYSGYSPLEGVNLNGKLTLGENTADNGGLRIAYMALMDTLGGKLPPKIDGFSAEQRFFLGWAQVWREKIRDEAQRQRLVSDPHSPAFYRVNGVIRNVDAWYSAFQVQPGDKLYVAPADRVRIW